MKVAVLGWGSLLWDCRPEFDEQCGTWQFDGPVLPLEFSRVSQGRDDALTLVIDEQYGQQCKIAYRLSKRKLHEDAIADLRCREGTTLRSIGVYLLGGENGETPSPKALHSIAS
jgi:cation transport regulator ChaC